MLISKKILKLLMFVPHITNNILITIHLYLNNKLSLNKSDVAAKISMTKL